jgi:ribosome-binding factor A
VAETIRKYIAEVFARELFDPRLTGLMVTRVEIGSDLSTAKVHIRPLLATADPAARSGIENAANRVAPMLRKGLGAQLGIKKTPTLSFFYDGGQDAIDRVEELLGEIARDESTPSK